MATHNRPERLGHLIQKEVSDLLARKVKDPRIRFVTITRVKVSQDLGWARIYFSTPREEGLTEQAEAGLKSATGFIRLFLGKRLYLRKVPEIRFIADEEYEEALHVAEIINALSRGTKPGG